MSSIHGIESYQTFLKSLKPKSKLQYESLMEKFDKYKDDIEFSLTIKTYIRYYYIIY